MHSIAIRPTSIAMTLVAVAGIFASAALLAHADTLPTFNQSVQNGSNVAVSSAPIGTAVHNVVQVASSTASSAPSGTVDFNVFANTVCTGTATTQAGVALNNGFATSSATNITASGISYTAHYNGDASTTAATSQCIAVTPTSGSVSITNNLSTSTAVLAGSSVTDTATLSNTTASATGTVAYNVYSNNSCTTVSNAAGSRTVNNALVPASDSVQFNFAGTYYWQAVYSGDQNNSGVTSSCSALTVVATSTPVTPPVVTTPGSIGGKVFNDLNRNDVFDASDTGLSGYTVWLHSGKNYNGPVVATATTDGNGNYSFNNLVVGTYFVEEQEMAGLTQSSDDMKVTLASTSASATVNFANVAKKVATSTNNGHNGNDNNDHHDNGKHNGWFNNGKNK